MPAPDQRVHLVDEQDDLAIGLLDLVEHALEPLLEIAAILRTGDQRSHVERQQFAVLEPVRHVAIGDTQRQPLGDRGLADAGLADQHRVVLGPPREHLDRPADLLVAPDHRVELAVPSGLGEVAREAFERVVAILGRLRVRCPAPAQFLDGGVERLRGHPRLAERGRDLGSLGQQHRQQDPLDRDELIAGLGRDLLRLVDQPDRVAVHPWGLARPASRHRRLLVNERIDRLARRLGVPASRIEQPRRHSLLIVEQRLGEVRRHDPLVMLAHRDGLRSLHEAPRALGQFLEIHRSPPLTSKIVWHCCNTTLDWSATRAFRFFLIMSV